MRAIVMTDVGGPDVLRVADLPEPEIMGGHDVKVRIRAAGINLVDARLRAGDAVYFCDGGFGRAPGTYQEVRIVDERYLARKPAGLSFAEAAAAPLVTITAWEALLDRARIGQGRFTLVQGGAGGVGHMSVQIARLAGARVAVTVTAGAKAELAASLGAEKCIDYRSEDVREQVRAWTGADGADVVHDTVGGATFTASFFLVRPYGDLVSNVESRWADEAVTAMQQRSLRVSFTWMPGPSVFGWSAHRERQRAILEQAAEQFDAGDLRVAVGAAFPLERAADAHRALEGGQVTGKAVLTLD